MKIWLPYIHGGSGTDVYTIALAKGLQDAGHEAIVQKFSHNWQYFPWPLKRVSPPRGADIVLGNTWNGFAFHRPPTPLVTVEHHLVLDPALEPYKSWLQRLFHQALVKRFEILSKRASAVQVSVSHYTADVHEAVLGGKRALVIYNGIDTDFFTPAQKPHFREPGDPFHLLFVGNLTRRKGADMLPPLMRALGPNYFLEYAIGLRAAKSLDALPNAVSLGRLDHQGLLDAYHRADLLVFPSRLEGFGLVAAEAMACGIPVVATRGSALTEIVEDEVTGLLCKQDDIVAFAMAIRQLANDETLRLAMGNSGRVRVVANFSRSIMVSRYIQLFSEVAG